MMLFRSIVDMREAGALITRLRRRRIRQFLGLLERVPRPLHILDVGGTQFFWDMLGVTPDASLQITLLNTVPYPCDKPYFTQLVGDGCAMPQFADGAFDVVFSNSVIEHVGSFAAQQRMAAEIQRVGRRFFVQTPNYGFPLEPHFFFPGFHYLPIEARTWLVQRFALGWYPHLPDHAAARREVAAIRLLRRHELQALFPAATIADERAGPLTVSLIALGGW
jgi:hypothetical protein